MAERASVFQRKKRIGDVYIEKGLLDTQARDRLLRIAEMRGEKFLDVVLKEGVLSQEDLRSAFGEDYDQDLVSISPNDFPLATKNLFSVEKMIIYGFLPIGVRMENKHRVFLIGMLTPKDLGTCEVISKELQYPIRTALITIQDFTDILTQVYGADLDELLGYQAQWMHPMLFRFLRKPHQKNHRSYLVPLNANQQEQYEMKSSYDGSKESDSHQEKDPTSLRFQRVQAPSQTEIRDAKTLLFESSAPSALSYRVKAFEESSKSQNKAQNKRSEKRKEQRKDAPPRVLVGIKVSAPSTAKKNSPKRQGVIEQFKVQNISRRGLYLSGENLNALEVGKAYEMILTAPRMQQDPLREGDEPTDRLIYLSFIGKLLRKKEDQKSAALQIDYLPENGKELWEALQERPSLRVL
jgi:hypothetical protein